MKKLIVMFGSGRHCVFCDAHRRPFPGYMAFRAPFHTLTSFSHVWFYGSSSPDPGAGRPLPERTPSPRPPPRAAAEAAISAISSKDTANTKSGLFNKQLDDIFKKATDREKALEGDGRRRGGAGGAGAGGEEEEGAPPEEGLEEEAEDDMDGDDYYQNEYFDDDEEYGDLDDGGDDGPVY